MVLGREGCSVRFRGRCCGREISDLVRRALSEAAATSQVALGCSRCGWSERGAARGEHTPEVKDTPRMEKRKSGEAFLDQKIPRDLMFSSSDYNVGAAIANGAYGSLPHVRGVVQNRKEGQGSFASWCRDKIEDFRETRGFWSQKHSHRYFFSFLNKRNPRLL